MTSLRPIVATALLLAACAADEAGQGAPGDGTSPGTAADVRAPTGAAADATAPTDDGASPANPDGAASGGACDRAKPFSKYTALAEAGNWEAITSARITKDEKTLYTVRTKASVPTAYFATRASASVPFGAETPVPYAENPVARSLWAPDDGGRLLVSTGTKALAFQRIYELTRQGPGAPYSTPSMLSLVGDGEKVHLSDPFVTTSNAIYVSRVEPDVSGNARIYRSSSLASPSLEPVSELDANGEASPLLTADERTIYFASKRPQSPSPGWELLFRADRPTSAGTFGNIQHVDTKLLDDTASTLAYSRRVLPLAISADDCRLYVLQVRNQMPDRVVVLSRPAAQ